MKNSLQYGKLENIRLRDYQDERWLQEKIEQEPTILGLGELSLVGRERRQPTGGRIDFLFHDKEKQTMYEVEVMLGALNESHIIRAIEYWDIEKRRFPSQDHKAVIIAEDITNRFFNIVYLMNKSIPIIALQLGAYKHNETLFLTFTRVLDSFIDQTDVEEVAEESVDRAYYESRFNKGSLEVMDSVVEIARSLDPQTKVTYNKGHVAIGTPIRNYCWPNPRKSDAYCYLEIRVGDDNLDAVKTLLAENALPFTNKREDILGFSLPKKVFENNRSIIERIVQCGWTSYQA